MQILAASHITWCFYWHIFSWLSVLGIVHQFRIFVWQFFTAQICFHCHVERWVRIGIWWAYLTCQSISFVRLEMVSYVIYNFLNHENFHVASSNSRTAHSNSCSNICWMSVLLMKALLYYHPIVPQTPQGPRHLLRRK